MSEWQEVRLEDVCLLVTDGAHSSPPSVNNGYPMASVKDMTDFGINYGTCRQISVTDYQKLKRQNCEPQTNDVLIAKDGSYLKHTFLQRTKEDFVILSSIAIIRPNPELIFPKFLELLFNMI